MYLARIATTINRPLITCILSITLLLPASLVEAKLTSPLTTGEMIEQAEKLFGGLALSLQQTGDGHYYQLRLLKRSGKVVNIRINSLSGAMAEEVNADQQSP